MDNEVLTDGYAAWYAERIWALVPGVYKSLDVGPAPGGAGPLRELVNRIGAQAAEVRRGIDRMGENLSIETCDDWVIPYIGDLVATRLVSAMDAAAQRVDVAKTIYYRRRAGTVGLLEELAADVISRDARVVEFFRRLGRTRHQFDPPLSYRIENPLTGPAGFTGKKLERAEGLVGRYSGTPAGGFADLRNAYAASKAGSAFDEYAYTADFRAPKDETGRYNIRNLGVFLWWLQTFPIRSATPVSNGVEPSPCFTFDPTGRNIPLFAPSQRGLHPATSWGEDWKSPQEWTLPVAISELLWKLKPKKPWGSAFDIGLLAGGQSQPVDRNTVVVHPEMGSFSFVNGAVPAGTIVVDYSFGLLSEIGAGGFDTSLLSALEEPEVTATATGGEALNTLLGAIGGDATLEIGDSLTYEGPTQTLTVGAGNTIAVRSQNRQRAVLRWKSAAPAAWTIISAKTAEDSETELVLEGLLLQGADIVLQGNFDSVSFRMMTLDPGGAGLAPALFGSAIDGMELRPATVWVEGVVSLMDVERSILGPVRTRNGGTIEQLNISDSIVQAIPTHTLAAGEKATAETIIFDPWRLARELKYETGELAVQLVSASSTLQTELAAFHPEDPASMVSPALEAAMLAALETVELAKAEAAWPLALADLALGMDTGTVSLVRSTILGPTYMHELSASECILDDLATVENAQAGCVRFSAYAQGSVLHSPYRSVQVAPGAALFRSRDFGNPEYARLRSDVDLEIVGGMGTSGCGNTAPPAAASILCGAENGSEMGVYSLEQVSLKRQGLAFKFEEYAPIGQLPVWIDVN